MLKKTTIAFVTLIGTFSTFCAADPVAVQSAIPFAADAKIAQNIRNECTKLGSQFSSFTKEFGKKFKVDVQLVEKIDTQAKGRVLQMEITEAVSMGNAFIGHQKYTAAHGVLFENGTKIAEFDARRQSMGGAFAGYKGSCSVLGRAVKAMGKDVALWLQTPTDKAMLGDL